VVRPGGARTTRRPGSRARGRPARPVRRPFGRQAGRVDHGQVGRQEARGEEEVEPAEGNGERRFLARGQADQDRRQGRLKIGGSESTYYRLDTKKSVEFIVHGPTQVRLITRHLPVKGKIGRRSYTLQVDRDGKSVLKKKQSAPRAARGQLCGSKKERIGAARTVILRVPAGRHVYRLAVTQPGKGVAVRIFEEAKTRQGTRTSFKPDEYDRVCRFSSGSGPTYLYYHATAEKPIRFRVTGPTQLLVRTRLDLAVGDPAEPRYRIEVRRDNEPAGTYSYKTRQLTQGAYQDCSQIVPSEDRRLYLSVPKGTWTYELRPADATTPGFMARILIPRTAVGVSGRAAR